MTERKGQTVDSGPFVRSRYLTDKDMYQAMSEFIDSQQATISSLESELKEQCRVNGIGAQRELRLQTQINELRAAIKGAIEFMESSGYQKFPPEDPEFQMHRHLSQTLKSTGGV